MKFVAIAIFFLLSACSIQKNDLNLKDAMAYGVLIELNTINKNIEKGLLIRLYEVPNYGQSCFIETHGACEYEYYLSVSTFDEEPEVNIFKLNISGEITNTTWHLVEEPDYAEIQLSYRKYTSEALKNNDALDNAINSILLKISLKGVIETPL